MKLNHPWIFNPAALLLSGLVRRWFGTIDVKAWYFEPASDPAHPDCSSRNLYVFWHEYLLAALPFRGHCDVSVLLSRHRDTEIIRRVARHLGFGFVLGSTARGGVTAVRQVLADSKIRHLVLTPDGPRGPRRHLAPGAVYLASKLGMPLVPAGFGYERPWRTRSWDRFAVPKPFHRLRWIAGAPVQVPADLSRDGLEHYRRLVEAETNRLTTLAEDWAATGRPMAGECAIGMNRSWWPRHRQLPTTAASSGVPTAVPAEPD